MKDQPLPLFVECSRCGERWKLVTTPIDVSDLLKICKRAKCPNCAATGRVINLCKNVGPNAVTEARNGKQVESSLSPQKLADRITRRYDRMESETEQMIRDVAWWNKHRTDAPPFDAGFELVALQKIRAARAAWNAQLANDTPETRAEHERLSDEMTRHMESSPLLEDAG